MNPTERTKDIEARVDDSGVTDADITWLLERVKSARNEALEEAAKVAANTEIEFIDEDGYTNSVMGVQVAAAIRALKSKEGES